MKGLNWKGGRPASLTVLVVAVLVALGCASAPAAKSAAADPAPKAPAWTMETPAPSGGNTYFVGYADGSADAEAKATENATAGMITEIMRYIGVTITAESSATAKSTLDTFEADLVQTVTQSSSGRVSGFQIAEKYVAKSASGVTVYLLGRYATKDLEAEKRRIAAVFQEKLDAVAVPEAEGQALSAAGDAIGAARKFIEAAAAAAGSGIENADIKFERNINSAKAALAKVSIEKLNDRLQASPGQPFAEPFRALVKADGRPLAKVAVLVGYQARLANGRMTTKSVTLLSGDTGEIAFAHPSADFVGKAVLTMRLDLSAATEPLYGISDRFGSMVAGLEDAISDKRASFEYTVVSLARGIPTAVLVADADSAGAVSVGITSSALLQTLSKNGFKVSAAPLAAAVVASQDDAAILAAARSALAGKAERFAYGLSQVVSVKDDRGQKIATVSVEVKVVDLADGRLLYSAVKQVPAVGASEKAAVDAARRQLGQKTIGEDMAAQLP